VENEASYINKSKMTIHQLVTAYDSSAQEEHNKTLKHELMKIMMSYNSFMNISYTCR